MAKESKIKVRTASEAPIKQDAEPGKTTQPDQPPSPPGQKVSSRSSKVIQPPSSTKGPASSSSAPRPDQSSAANKTDIGKAATSSSGSIKLTKEELSELEKDMASNPIPGAVAEPPTPSAEDTDVDKSNSNQQQTPQTQPQPGGSGTTPPPVVMPQHTGGSRFNKKRILLVAGIVALGVLLFWAYLQFIAPRFALARYVDDLDELNTGNYSLQVVFKQGGEGADDPGSQATLDATAQGDFDNREDGNTKLSSNVDGTLDFGGFTTGINVDAMVEGNTLYVNVGRLAVLGLFGGQDQQQDAWFSYDINQTIEASGCSEEDYAAYKEFLATRYKDHVRLNNTSRVSLLPESVEGNRAAHYRGNIDPASLQSFLNEANKEIPEPCRSENNDFEGLEDNEITYDLWSGRNFDRLKLTFTDAEEGTTIEAILTTQDYGKDVDIQIPADAQPFGNFNDLLQGGTPPAPTESDGADFTAPDTEVEVE